MDNILVSIICTTYNHENFIADAIDSFLMQKTDFEYEILIHDDASTDKTKEIIKIYEKENPGIIKPIFQTSNQYSKGKDVWTEITFQKAKGKYIALCEGDDYWIDRDKLQKQINYMEENENCSVCVHSANIVDSVTKKSLKKAAPSNQNKIFNIEEIINGGGGLFATNSMLFRSEYAHNIPNFYKCISIGDYPLMIHLAICGNVYYINDIMSSYRTGVEGSWTSGNNSIKKANSIYIEINRMLDQVNEYTNGKYNSVIKKRKLQNKFRLGENIKLLLLIYLPNTARVLKMVRRKFKL